MNEISQIKGLSQMERLSEIPPWDCKACRIQERLKIYESQLHNSEQHVQRLSVAYPLCF